MTEVLQTSFIIKLLLSPIYLFIFIAPGLLISGYLIRKYVIDQKYIVLFSFFFSCLICYLSFWIYFFNDYAGITFSIVTTACSFSILINRRNHFGAIIRSSDFYLPLILNILVGYFYLSILFMINDGNPDYEMLIRRRFLPFLLGPDNIMPLYVSDLLYTGKNLKSLFFGHYKWLTSDRGCLFESIITFLRPFSFLFGKNSTEGIELFGHSNQMLVLYYQFVGTMIQSTWVIGLWSLCRHFRLDARETWFILGICIFSGFFMFHSLFLWPKIITIPMIILCFIMLINNEYTDERNFLKIFLGAAAGGMAYLFHGAALFSLFAIATIILFKKDSLKLKIKHIIVGCFCFIIIIAPWTLYQKIYDPPGNRLIKMHLGGYDKIDDRSAIRTVIDQYESQDFKTTVENKITNLKVIFKLPSINELKDLNLIRVQSYYHMFYSLGFLNIGFIILLYKLALKYLGKYNARISLPIKLSLIFSVIYIFYWSLLIFGLEPSALIASTTIHNGSFANMLFLYFLACLLLYYFPSLIVNAIYYLNIGFFFCVWIIGNKGNFTDKSLILNIPMLIISLLCLTGLIVVLQKIKFGMLFTRANR